MLNWHFSLWNLPIFFKYNAAAIAKITQFNNAIYNISLFQKVAYFKKELKPCLFIVLFFKILHSRKTELSSNKYA